MSFYNSNINYVNGLPVFCFVGTHLNNHGLGYGMQVFFFFFLIVVCYSYHSTVICHLYELCDESGYLIYPNERQL